MQYYLAGKQILKLLTYNAIKYAIFLL